jgi:hypothetical protein
VIVARQFIAWNAQKNASRPVGNGMIKSTGRSSTLWRSTVAVNTSGSAAHTVTYGTVTFFGHIPGNKLPGYAHLVPPGQRLSILVHDFGASSRDRFEHDKETDYPAAPELLIASTRS